MANRTEREFMIALGRLLDRVRVLNKSWSIDTFREASTHVANVSKSEATRFQQALLEMNYLKEAGDKRKLKDNFDPKYYKNTDACLAFISEILEANPDIVQTRGPRKGSKRIPVINNVVDEIIDAEVITPEILEEIPCEITLQDYTAQDLVTELRNRGYAVTCVREVITIETL